MPIPSFHFFSFLFFLFPSGTYHIFVGAPAVYFIRFYFANLCLLYSLGLLFSNLLAVAVLDQASFLPGPY